MKKCRCCRKSKPKGDFYAHRKGRDGLFSQCKKCCARKFKRRYRNGGKQKNENRLRRNWKRSLLNGLRNAAKRRGLEFDLEEQDLVAGEFCPVLGIPLVLPFSGPRVDGTVTADRRNNSLGYISGNVVLISWRANRLKSDASSEELRLMSKFYG